MSNDISSYTDAEFWDLPYLDIIKNLNFTHESLIKKGRLEPTPYRIARDCPPNLFEGIIDRVIPAAWKGKPLCVDVIHLRNGSDHIVRSKTTPMIVISFGSSRVLNLIEDTISYKQYVMEDRSVLVLNPTTTEIAQHHVGPVKGKKRGEYGETYLLIIRQKEHE